MNIEFNKDDLNKASVGNWQMGDDFFNHFHWLTYLTQMKYGEVLFYGLNLLNNIKSNHPTSYKKIHKGTPFYWMGMAAFLSYDYVTANLMFDAALTEDLNKKTDDELKISPSFLFATLDNEIQEQAAKSLVDLAYNRINEFINIYNDPLLTTSTIGFSNLRENFIKKAISKENKFLRSLSTSFISFFLEWDYRQYQISLLTDIGSYEAFYMHLFKGCLIFESLLKANQIKPVPLTKDYQTLGSVLGFYQKELNLDRNNLKIGNATLPDIIKELPELIYKLPKCIEITGKIRNTLGHNLIWDTEINSENYYKLFLCISLSCIHAINLFY
jgi:hypothetical protein